MASLGDTEVTPGQILAGKFRIERVLGRGGMGVVVLATHIQLDEQVAIKFLLPEALKNPEAVRRFEREARAAVKIKSEHVARVTDVGTLDTGSPYMVMEYLNGCDLAEYLHERGPLPVDEAIDYLMQAIEAIAEAHALNIIHRDLKPANLFRIQRADGSPSIKVLDFGISKLSGADASMTQTSSMMGSPYYMSPEQMTSSKTVDARTDVWALGVILYELVSGQVPFDGESVPEIVAKVLQNSPPRIERAGFPPALGEVLLTALTKDREQRYSDVAALAIALAPFGPTHSRTSVQRVSRVLGVATDFTLPDGAAQRTRLASSADGHAETTFNGAARTDLNLDLSPPKHSYRTALVSGLVFLAAAGIFAAFSWTSSGERAPLAGTTSAEPANSGTLSAASPATADKPEAAPAEPPGPKSDPKAGGSPGSGSVNSAGLDLEKAALEQAAPEKPSQAREQASESEASPSAASTAKPTQAKPTSAAARGPTPGSTTATHAPPRPKSPVETTPPSSHATAPATTPVSAAPARGSKSPVDLFSDRK
jgi:eukaryotic-like serine/threonine-protein kinase